MDSTSHTSMKTTFTPEQEAYFRKLQSEGLTGTGKNFQAILEQAVHDTNFPMQVVRNKVHNMQRSARATQDTAAPARKHMQVRKLSAYNHFCHLIGSKSNDKCIRQRIWSRMWGELTNQQKQWYHDEVAKLNNAPLSELQGERREAAINTSKDAIMYHMKRLEKLQPFHGVVILTDKETVWSSSCGVGNELLEEQENQLQVALSQVDDNGIQPTNKKKLRDNLRKAAEAKLREMYGKFCNLEEESPFPYKDYISGNADFLILGLPEGFVLKKPGDMGQKRNQTVLDSQLSIVARERETCIATPSVDSTSREVFALSSETTPGSSSQHHTTESTSFGREEQLSSEDVNQMDSTTYEISVNEDSVTVETQNILQHEEPMDEGDITTIPHLSAEEAMSSVQAMAEALEKRNSKGLQYERDDKGKVILRSILGKTIFQLWTMINPGQPKSKQWYKGAVVETKPGKYAIHFLEDDVLEPLSASKATKGLSKGTLLLLDQGH